MKITMPTLVDGMDNAAGNAYAAAPVRMYVIGTDGKIAYMGGRGPWGFSPAEMEKFLAKMFAGVQRRGAKPPE